MELVIRTSGGLGTNLTQVKSSPQAQSSARKTLQYLSIYLTIFVHIAFKRRFGKSY